VSIRVSAHVMSNVSTKEREVDISFEHEIVAFTDKSPGRLNGGRILIFKVSNDSEILWADTSVGIRSFPR
jgi:hypothetical protein